MVIRDNFWQILLECQNYLEVRYSEASSRFEVLSLGIPVVYVTMKVNTIKFIS